MSKWKDSPSENYQFEISDEVRQKIASAENRHEAIPEERVQDLHYIAAPNNGYEKVKRFFDIVLSFCGLAVLSIPMAIVALVIYIDDPGNVIFSQYRVGRYGKRFKLYKFRTMRLDTPKYLATKELADPKKYITRVGRFFRKTSLDELPQLVNVLKGDMSLVGPRPLISDEYEIHDMRMRFGVYNIRPGVTGLAQINGRDLVSPADKVHWDVRYLENFGPMLDLKILLATIPKIFGGEGVVEGFPRDEIQAQEPEEDCQPV